MPTLYDALACTAAAHPDRAFFCVPPRAGRGYLPGGCEITYAQARAAAEALSDAYAAAGWGPGHRVALALDNHPGHFLHFLALTRIGVSQVPVNPYYLRHELEYLLGHSEADMAVALPWNVAKLREAGGLPMTEWGDDSDPAAFAPPPAPTAPRHETPGQGSEIALVYTSGTTSRPKGCILDNAFAFAVGARYRDIGGALTLEPGRERIFNPLPAFHVNGGVNTVAAMILTANCLIMPDRFHAESWWEDLAATGATAMHYLGVIPPVLLKQPPSPHDREHGLKFGLGAGLDPAIHRAFEERFGIPMVEVWGMTETGRFFADCHEPRKIDTRAFGRPDEDFQAVVADEAGNEVPRGTPGELLVRDGGPDPRRGFFRGYLKNPEATEEAWRGGWFHTGDVVTQDDSGMLCFVERARNLIRRSGENISAAEVEDALIDHPGVKGVAVMACPDEMRDEEVFACLVPADGARADRAAAESVLDFARERLAYYKLPGWVAFMEELPVTGTQKIQKHRIFEAGADPREDPRAIDLRAAKSARRRAPA
ncbi:MAG: AMP-binding protein [Pseudomonadota bacterium]